ncbi:MAG: hypothetical protein H6706_21595 [Myxococcales bacterium]|nr:hypothetical protein [Myxococcales bacterium]
MRPLKTTAATFALVLSASAAHAAVGNGSQVTMDGYVFHFDPADVTEDPANREALINGTVSVDMAGGMEIDLIDATLVLRQAVDGTWSVTEGWAESLGTDFDGLSELGNLSSAAAMSVGFRRGSDLDLEGQLNPDKRYLYLQLQLGAGSMSFGDLDVDTDPQREVFLAVDPTTPALFFRAQGVFPQGSYISVDEAKFGFSADHQLHVTPVSTWGDPLLNGSPRYLTPVDGNLYVAGTLSLGLAEQYNLGVSASSDLEALVDNDWQAMLRFEDSLRALALNGDLAIEVNLLVHTFNLPLGAASVVYRRGQYAVASGTFNPRASLGPLKRWLTFPTTGKAYFRSHGGRGTLSVQVSRVELVEGLAVDDFTLSVTNNAAAFAGKLDLGSTRLNASGSIASNGDFSVSAEASFQEKFGNGTVKFSGTVTTTVTQGGASFDAFAKACFAGSCDRVDASVELDNGRLKICARLPSVGKKCTKI